MTLCGVALALALAKLPLWLKLTFAISLAKTPELVAIVLLLSRLAVLTGARLPPTRLAVVVPSNGLLVTLAPTTVNGAGLMTGARRSCATSSTVVVIDSDRRLWL